MEAVIQDELLISTWIEGRGCTVDPRDANGLDTTLTPELNPFRASASAVVEIGSILDHEQVVLE